MKKLLTLAIVLLTLLSCVNVLAGEPQSSVTLHADFADFEWIAESDLTFDILNTKNEVLNTQKIKVSKETPNVTIKFSVPEYQIGEKFSLKLTGGAYSFKMYDKTYPVNEPCEIQTYAYKTEDGEVKISTDFHVTVNPYLVPLTCPDLTLKMDLTTTQRLSESVVRFNVFNEKGEFLANSYVSVDRKNPNPEIKFPIGPFDAGMKFKVVLTEGAEYVTYYDKHYGVQEPFEVETYTYRDKDGKLQTNHEFYLTLEPFTTVEAWKTMSEAKVKNIKSKTDYMVWVSKKDYRVTAFKKINGVWKYQNDFPCTIGKPSTPTITGEFDYIETIPRWSYAKYYCGPVMRFHNGYALHSTLVKYDGTFYDGRLEMQLSLGCVRLDPPDIQWLVKTIPLKSKIYITE